MNAFEKDARMIQHGDIVSAWVGFVAAFHRTLKIYRANHPRSSVRIIPTTEDQIVIRCHIAQAPEDEPTVLTVSVSAEVVEFEVMIRCTIQRWHGPREAYPLSIDYTKPMHFILDGEYLRLEKRRMNPAEAAEALLEEALLKP